MKIRGAIQAKRNPTTTYSYSEESNQFKPSSKKTPLPLEGPDETWYWALATCLCGVLFYPCQ